ncbi:hypothetical protein, partial [Citrobacter sedlakii]|uniref:hypothetical protein n=1 Tax=Citrobacter sedlakii TaxID=67826 RepID=UPI00313A1BA3
ADAMLADLLGAALVDAREELIDAVDALDRAGYPQPFDAYLDAAPPWPPTSVDRLRQRPDSGPLLDALAREVAGGDAGEAVRLVDSWARPPRPIDGEWLRAWGGSRIASEPRFRAWLRGEWTAWARQHYRRIAREVGRVGATSARPGGAS